jgi:hypothetical protein
LDKAVEVLGQIDISRRHSALYSSITIVPNIANQATLEKHNK